MQIIYMKFYNDPRIRLEARGPGVQWHHVIGRTYNLINYVYTPINHHKAL